MHYGGNMTSGSDNFNQKTDNQLIEDIYAKSSLKLNVMGCSMILIFIAMAKFVSGTVLFWTFVVFYVVSIVGGIILQNREVEEITGNRPDMKGKYWTYAIRRRLKILGFLGTMIFGIFFRFILPALDEGMKDAHGR